MDGRGLAEDETSRRAAARRVEAKARQPLQRPLERDARLQPGEVHAEADVRPMGERDLEVEVRAARLEAVGIGKDVRVAIRARQRERDEVAPRDRGAAELDVPCVA